MSAGTAIPPGARGPARDQIRGFLPQHDGGGMKGSSSSAATATGVAAPPPPVLGIFERYLTLWVALCIVVGIVLGAGGSRRLGRPKQTLTFGDTTLLGWVVRDVGASAPGRSFWMRHGMIP